MRVKVFPFNKEEAINKLFLSCRTCYNPGSPIDMYDEILQEENPDVEKKIKLLRHVLNSGHHSVLEHLSVTIMVEGINRATSHQLVRHRLASYSQQSQRYVEFKDGKFDFVMPPSIAANQDCRDFFYDVVDHITEAYNFFIKNGIKAEDARAILPNACCTNIVMTLNLRELIHICNERLCTCAQGEIRQMFREVAKQVGETLDFMKPYLQPKCEMLGYCNESKQRSCGRKQVREEVLNGRDNSVQQEETRKS